MSKLTKCPNGHAYRSELSECPYCNSERNSTVPKSSSQVTQIIGNLSSDSLGLKTTTDDEPVQIKTGDIDPHRDFSKTQIDGGEEDDVVEVASGSTEKEYRNVRKLVGWLVTYTQDENGQDYRLYEGRNMIGRDITCGISINDKKVSSQHAILLYRNGKYLIKDNLSANGTMVNSEDIDDRSCVLKDGDAIQVGDTVFVFRTTIPKDKD